MVGGSGRGGVGYDLWRPVSEEGLQALPWWQLWKEPPAECMSWVPHPEASRAEWSRFPSFSPAEAEPRMRQENVDFGATLTRVASCLCDRRSPPRGQMLQPWVVRRGTEGPCRGPAAPGARPTEAAVTSPASLAQPCVVLLQLDPVSPAWFLNANKRCPSAVFPQNRHDLL